MLMQPGRPLAARRVAAIAIATTLLATAIAIAGVVALTTRTAHGAIGGGGCLSPNVCQIKSHNAFADFSSVNSTPTTCVASDASIQAFQALTSPGHNTTPGVFISIFKFDCLSGNFIESVNNIDPNTGVPDFNGSAQFSTLLNTASVVGSAPMYDGGGNFAFTTNVNLTWQAYGSTTTIIDSMHIRGAGIIVNTHSIASTRSAIASGSITDEVSSNLASQPTIQALVQDATSGVVQVFKS